MPCTLVLLPFLQSQYLPRRQVCDGNLICSWSTQWQHHATRNCLKLHTARCAKVLRNVAAISSSTLCCPKHASRHTAKKSVRKPFIRTKLNDPLESIRRDLLGFLHRFTSNHFQLQTASPALKWRCDPATDTATLKRRCSFI